MKPKENGRIVIIGGVAGGASAATRARRENEKAEIIILEKGNYVSFANCGLPYFISNDIKKRSKLIVQTPEMFKSRFNIDVRLEHNVTSIDPDEHRVEIETERGTENLFYDKLILSTGSNPLVPPITGAESDMAFTLWNIPEMDAIERYIKTHDVKQAVVVGAGFVGLEMVEAFVARDIKVSLVELSQGPMPLLDLEFSNQITEVLKEKGVSVFNQKAVKVINEQSKTVTLDNGDEIAAELVLLSAGVKPNIDLAEKAGLKLGNNGGVWVQVNMKTSDPDIYAVGDIAEIPHGVYGDQRRIPLAGPANRAGRLTGANAARELMGQEIKDFKKSYGTSVVKIFDYTVSSVGLSEAQAKKAGIEAESVSVHRPNHATYYPGSKTVHLKLVFQKETGDILGAQAMGKEGVEKRIDVIATAMAGGLKATDLEDLDLAYAPPYSSANDPVNYVGMVASNHLSDFSPTISAEAFIDLWRENPEIAVLDVRSRSEWDNGHLKNAQLIPIDDLREQIKDLDPEKEYYIHCGVGYRAHLALRILKQEGFKSVKNISGGWTSLTLLLKNEEIISFGGL